MDESLIATALQLKKVLKPLIEKNAFSYGLDPSWFPAIITQESRWNLLAVRYEPNYAYLYRPEQFTSGFNSMATEVNTQKTSWGLGQIMGALAREQGHTGLMAELLIPDINIKHMAIRLAGLKKRSTEADFIFAGYNGGPGAMHKLANGQFPNQQYVDGVRKYLVKAV